MVNKNFYSKKLYKYVDKKLKKLHSNHVAILALCKDAPNTKKY
jgi:hypothetical protein